MSSNQTVPWLVIYDIADPKRLARVFKALKKVGVPVQYSVFSVDANAMGMANLMAQLALLIQPNADDIRAYRLPENGWRATLGNTMLPEGVWLV
jgi:CRISPR-associated protein Cas2